MKNYQVSEVIANGMISYTLTPSTNIIFAGCILATSLTCFCRD